MKSTLYFALIAGQALNTNTSLTVTGAINLVTMEYEQHKQQLTFVRFHTDINATLPDIIATDGLIESRVSYDDIIGIDDQTPLTYATKLDIKDKFDKTYTKENIDEADLAVD